ncbi:MAG TPA: MFS transporter, partial [Rugosimonospora sp.]|nr:MFS transporter [Rugosimonospora sp.]
MTAVTDAPSTRPAASPEYVSLPGAYLIAFLSRASGMGMIAMIGPYLLDRGVPVRFIGVVMVFSALGSAASGLVAGRVVDRFGPWRAMVGGLLTALAGVAVFVSVPWWPLLAPAYLITTGGSAASGNAVRTTIGLHAPPHRRER